MSSTIQQCITAAEFWRLPGDKKYQELVRGEVVEAMPPGGTHGRIVARLLARLQMWAESGNYGNVSPELGYRLFENPDTVRGPDVSFVAEERIPATGIPQAFWELAPDLAVEVVSPTETASDVQTKIQDYLTAGAKLVWVAYPASRIVVVHTPDGLSRTLQGDQRLESESAEVLPGFTCTVEELFL